MDFDSGITFAVGTANVAGQSNKVDVLSSLPGGLWSLTETHLTAAGMRPTQAAIKQMGHAVGRNLRTPHQIERWTPMRVLGLVFVLSVAFLVMRLTFHGPMVFIRAAAH